MTMTCGETEARLVDIVDGRLDPPTEMRVHAHLEGCAACRGKAELWRALLPGMRSLAPTPPTDLAARRLQVNVQRGLREPAAARRALPRLKAFLAGGLVLAGAAAALVMWLHAARTPTTTAEAAPPYATVKRIAGHTMTHGQALAVGAPLSTGAEIEVAAGAGAELGLDRGSTVRLAGPARLALAGTPRDVELRLADGTLEAEVAHRLANETFVVSTRDARVEVRGTRFRVTTGAAGSTVRVDEGSVAVRFADGSSRLVAAGEEATTIVAAPDELAPVDEAAATQAAQGGQGGLEGPSCTGAAHRCQSAAREARESMRGGDSAGALRIVAGATRTTCAREVGACADELRYLRAEALRGTGRIDDAIAAYRGLTRGPATAAMRQNALYAAAELERRQGRMADARADYESALAAAPRGVLREEALIGAMESAALAGEHARAATLGQRYLSDFPRGRAAQTADRLAREGAGRR
jgi:ferric-dicitrate binding protein FerR (iron transport regulator)